MSEFYTEAEREPSAGSARKGYTRRTGPRTRLDVGRSHGVERTHVGGAGNDVQRDESLFRGRGLFTICNPWTGEPIPMREPPTGEPCAGEPHARFGGRGRREPFPTPIRLIVAAG